MALAFVGAVALAPGWTGWLVPVEHDEILAAARVSGAPFGVTVAGADASAPGVVIPGEWHAEYLDSGLARMLAACGLRGFAPSLVPPDFAAHVPPSPGALKPADGYFRIVTAVHWPWWRPGGGVEWRRPKG